jgi:hypothetical protein
MDLGPNPRGDIWSPAQGVSANGSVIVGRTEGPFGFEQAYRWTAHEGIVGLGRVD